MKKTEYAPPIFIGQNLYIKPSYIFSRAEFYRENDFRSQAQIENQINLTDNEKHGKLSRKAVQGLRNAINWLCLAAQPKRVYIKKTAQTFKFKINFITLTLPDTETAILSEDFQKHLLNPFLVYMRKYHELKNYVWRLEFQANGKLHAHLTTDTFLHLKAIREQWNRLLLKKGYLHLFKEKHGHTNPNSTDVHATKSIKNIAGYLAKYMSKKNSFYTISKKLKVNRLRAPLRKDWYKQRLNFWNSRFNPRAIKGRIWSCNYELSKASKCSVHIPADQCATELRQLMQPNIEYKRIYTYPVQTEFLKAYPDHPSGQPRQIGELYFLKAKDWVGNLKGMIYQAFEDTRLMVASLARNYTIFELN